MTSHSLIYENGWLDRDTLIVSQILYKNRFTLQDFEEASTEIVFSNSSAGSVFHDNLSLEKVSLNLGEYKHLYQESKGLKLSWNSRLGKYDMILNPNLIRVSSYKFFSFRCGQSFENKNSKNKEQEFTIVFEDGRNSESFSSKNFGSLLYPSETVHAALERKTVMQSFLIPLKKLVDRGINLDSLQKISFKFDRSDSGVLYFDDIVFCSDGSLVI